MKTVFVVSWLLSVTTLQPIPRGASPVLKQETQLLAFHDSLSAKHCYDSLIGKAEKIGTTPVIWVNDSTTLTDFAVESQIIP